MTPLRDDVVPDNNLISLNKKLSQTKKKKGGDNTTVVCYIC